MSVTDTTKNNTCTFDQSGTPSRRENTSEPQTDTGTEAIQSNPIQSNPIQPQPHPTMMMSKPSPEDTEEETAPPPTTLDVGSVADLERRLALMGSDKKPPAAAAPPPAAPVVAAPAPAPVAAAPAVKGGKNALLARIMAAKEKQEKKQVAPPAAAPSATTTDLLMDFDAPAPAAQPAPPAYDTNFLKDVPPPSFDVLERKQQQQLPPPMDFLPPPTDFLPPPTDFLPPPPIDSVLPPPPPLNDVLPPPSMPPPDLMNMGYSPSAPSAPMFEDLHTQQQELHPPPLPPPMEAQPPPELDIDASILNALEPAEREAFLEEQRKILEQIEKEKANNEASGAAARAMAFDQRSTSAVANVAASYERGGRPPAGSGEELDAETAQMIADAELAEKLQKEEYSKSQERRNRVRSGNQTQQQRGEQQSSEESQSWYDWLTGSQAPAPAPATRSSPSPRASSSGSRTLVSAQTGEEGLTYASGFEGGGGARTAEQKSMFACVADSINVAATQMYALPVDEEGNVHGVDSQGLLAMPDVSRQRDN
ncbi:unnamed protein product [Pseudo-nitzschia multistriata]|uniref:Uncharacterized protein n=1 Tax=Pseudo-nitzschia multistriata TaxID=183589 RepID=A0A448YYJ5_9STRA|nr:unnamed protein product [Pseudo-nitzschia multistriata]